MTKYVEKALYEKLKALAGGRVYALRATQNSVAPFIVFQQTEGERWRGINGSDGFAQVSMRVDAYAETLYACKDLAAQIEDILDGFRGTVSYGSDSPQEFVKVAGISLQSDSVIIDQTAEPFLYRNTASYLITFET